MQTVSNALGVMSALQWIVPMLSADRLGLNGNHPIDINAVKERFRVFKENNLLIRYLIESEQLIPDDDRSNRASALRLMRENLDYQDEVLALKANESNVDRFPEWMDKIKTKWNQLKDELVTAKAEQSKNARRIQLNVAAANAETTAVEIQANVERLEEQLAQIRDSSMQLRMIVEEAKKMGMDQRLRQLIATANESGALNFDFTNDRRERYSLIQLWGRLLLWNDDSFEEKTIKVFGCISCMVIKFAVGESFRKFFKVHVKPTTGIEDSTIVYLIRNKTFNEAETFVHAAESFGYWKKLLYVLRGYLRMSNCDCSTEPQFSTLDAYG